MHISEVQTKQSVLLDAFGVMFCCLVCCAACFVLLFLDNFCQVKSTGLSSRLKKATSHCEPTTCGFEEDIDNIEIQNSVQRKLQLCHLFYCANFDCFQKPRCQNFYEFFLVLN